VPILSSEDLRLKLFFCSHSVNQSDKTHLYSAMSQTN